MTNYYTKQLNDLKDGDYLKVKFTCDNAQSNWLNINLESIEAIENFLADVKAQLIAAIPGSHQSEQWEKHQIGLALAKLLGAKRNRDNDTRFDTPIGDKTPIGIYETVKAVMADNPADPRYTELFPPYNAK